MNRPSFNLEPRANSYNLRIFLLLFTIVIFIFLVVLRLFNLQVLDHEYYQNLASNQHGLTSVLLPKRGDIYISAPDNPRLVATSINKDTVYAIPKQIIDKKSTANRLASILSIPAAQIIAKISGNGSYSILSKEVSSEISTKIKAAKLTGVYLEAQDARFYPEGNLASQVIGFLGYEGADRIGQYGVEGKFEKSLSGTPGLLGTDKDSVSRWITFASRNLSPALDGDDIYLTIDSSIQTKVQQVLADAVQKHGADGGSVIVVNPKDGQVLAMASFPDFDPNNYGKAKDATVYNNQAVIAEYEPGSIFKAITMAASLNEGKVTPQTTYDNTGILQVDDKQIKNSDPTVFLGPQSMITVLDESLNTGAVFAQQQIGNDTFKKYVENFGFGKPVDFELSSQIPGNLDNLDKKGNIFFATASYGQGITVTPLQMVQAYTAIANGGKLAKPYIVKKIVHPNGSEDVTKPSKQNEVIDSKTAVALSAMLVDVVENGHGKKAAVKGYYIAGKTGTAQVAFKDKTGYDPNINIGSFIGFGPVDDPKFLMLVRIDNPKDVKFAESTAAPAFGEIAQYILDYLQVPPSR